MPPMHLPTPRVEALLFCTEVIQDDAQALNLRGVGDGLVVLGQPPFVVKGFIYARYAPSRGSYVVSLRVRAVATGETVLQLTGDDPLLPNAHGIVTTTIPISIDCREPGLYALVLIVDGMEIGTSTLTIRAMPS